MKQYDRILVDGLSYESVVIESKILEGKGNVFITRPEWDGVHFMVKDDYFILTKDNKLIANAKEVYDLDKNDWMIVNVTKEASELIINLVNDYYNKKRKTRRRK